MSIIVTGASGHLGRLVIDELLTTVPAAEVAAVVRDPDKAADLAARGVEHAVARLQLPESFDGLLRAGDRVLLISGNEMHRDRASPSTRPSSAPPSRRASRCSPTPASSASGAARSTTTTAPPRTPSSPPGSHTACCATACTTRWPR